MRILFRMMANSIPRARTGGNACLDIEINLNTNSGEGKDYVEVTPKEIVDLVDSHERKS